MDFSKRLVESKLIVSSKQKSLDSVDFCLSIDRDLKIQLLEIHFCVFRLDNLSVNVVFR